MIFEKHVLEEMRNIADSAPLFPGHTISHTTANECVKRGWAVRDSDGNFIPTARGARILATNPSAEGG